jgi:hypothetical protein
MSHIIFILYIDNAQDWIKEKTENHYHIKLRNQTLTMKDKVEVITMK